MSKWQPIESAPKDGTPIRLKCGGPDLNLGVHNAAWRRAHSQAPWMYPHSYEECHGHLLRWRTPDGMYDVAPGREPVWMPLPTPLKLEQV